MSLREFSLMWRDAGLSLAAYGQGAVSMPGQSSKSGGSPTPGDSARPGSGKGGGSSPDPTGGGDGKGKPSDRAFLAEKHIRIAFANSKMMVVDQMERTKVQQQRSVFSQLTFTEFLEAVAIVADSEDFAEGQELQREFMRDLIASQPMPDLAGKSPLDLQRMEAEYEKDVLSKRCGLSWKLLVLLSHIFSSQKAFRESKKEHWKAYFGEFGDAEHPWAELRNTYGDWRGPFEDVVKMQSNREVKEEKKRKAKLREAEESGRSMKEQEEDGQFADSLAAAFKKKK